MNRVFPAAPLDGTTRAITLGVIVLVGVVIPVSVAADDGGLAAGLSTALLAGAATLGAWAFSPTGYELDGHDLVVHRRLLRSRRFPIEDATVEPVGGSWLPGWLHLRLAGSGGFFGWFGVFWRVGEGRFNAYVTARDRGVRIERPGEPDVVVSPQDVDGFVAAWQEVLT